MMNKKFTVLGSIGVLATLLAIPAALMTSVLAQENQTFSANLTRDGEVPPTKSNATGVAQFQVGNNGSQVSYSVNLTGFDDIAQAEINSGVEGENGPVVVTLSKGAEADGDSVELELNGDLQANDLKGPLEDKEISDLVDLMNNGSAYVNIQTEIYPDGAIRGQIASGELSVEGTSAGENVTGLSTMDNTSNTSISNDTAMTNNTTLTNST